MTDPLLPRFVEIGDLMSFSGAVHVVATRGDVRWPDNAFAKEWFWTPCMEDGAWAMIGMTDVRRAEPGALVSCVVCLEHSSRR